MTITTGRPSVTESEYRAAQRKDQAARIEGFGTGSKDFGAEIALNKITAHADYQRDFKPWHAKQIAKNFDKALWTPPTVARREGGTFAVIDGQHRIAALRLLLGDDSTRAVFCHVLSSESELLEAKQFLGHNAVSIKATGRANFNALVAAGDPNALRTREVIQRYGFKLHLSAGVARPGEMSPTTVLRIIRRHGERWDIVEDTLAVARNAFGYDQLVSGSTVVGLASFIVTYRNHPLYSQARLIEALRKESANKIERDALTLKSMSKGSDWTNSRKSILMCYNHGRRMENRLPEVN